MQSELYSDMQDSLCGKRGASSFKTSTKAKIVDGKFKCHTGTVLCGELSTVDDKIGFCVSDKSECPVTDLVIYSGAKPSEIDSRYTVAASSKSG